MYWPLLLFAKFGSPFSYIDHAGHATPSGTSVEPTEVRERSCFIESKAKRVAFSQRSAIEEIGVRCHGVREPGVIDKGNGCTDWHVCDLK